MAFNDDDGPRWRARCHVRLITSPFVCLRSPRPRLCHARHRHATPRLGAATCAITTNDASRHCCTGYSWRRVDTSRVTFRNESINEMSCCLFHLALDSCRTNSRDTLFDLHTFSMFIFEGQHWKWERAEWATVAPGGPHLKRTLRANTRAVSNKRTVRTWRPVAVMPFDNVISQ